MLWRLLVIYGSKGFYALLLVAASTYIARVWGAEALGEYSVLMTLLTIGSVLAVFGADMRYIETAPRLVDDLSDGKMYSSRVLLAVFCQSLVVTPMLLLAAHLLIPELGWGASALISMALVTTIGSILISQNRQFLHSMLTFILRPTVFLAALFAAVVAGLDFASSVIVPLNVSFVLVAVIGIVLLCSYRFGAVGLKEYFTGDWWRAAWVYVVIGLYPILFAQADRLLVLQMVGARETGVYSAAQNILNIVNYGVNAVMALALPIIASLLASKIDRTDFDVKVKRLARGVFAFAIACVIIFAFWGSHIVSIFGPEFSEATVPLLIMGLGVAGGLIFGFPITVLTLSESRRSVVSIFIVVLGVSLVLSALGILWFGLIGAAVAASISNIASRAVFHWVCVRRTGISTAIF